MCIASTYASCGRQHVVARSARRPRPQVAGSGRSPGRTQPERAFPRRHRRRERISPPFPPAAFARPLALISLRSHVSIERPPPAPSPAGRRAPGREPLFTPLQVDRCHTAQGTLFRVMKRFHVTTFGCQMNEHDSERMKGMLESLGYAEVPEREEADLILFNTCSIREKADERFVSHLYEARALKRRDPERVIGVGGCWAQSVKDQVFRALPVRRRRVRPRPGPQAGRVPDQRLADRPGLLRVRGLHRPPAGQARARRPRAGCRSRPAAT